MLKFYLIMIPISCAWFIAETWILNGRPIFQGKSTWVVLIALGLAWPVTVPLSICLRLLLR